MAIYVAPYTNRANPKFGLTNRMITLDAFISETHNYTNQVTSHPVEDGAAITDNVVNDPVELELECVVSPYGIAVDNRGNPERADTAYRDLMRLYRAKVPVSVHTGLVTYSSMAITSISVPRTKASSQTLRFTISFRKVRIVGAISVELDTFTSGNTYWENAQGVYEDGFEPAVDKTAVDIARWGGQAATRNTLGNYDFETGQTIDDAMYTKSLPEVNPDLPEIDLEYRRDINNNVVRSDLQAAPIDNLLQ